MNDETSPAPGEPGHLHTGTISSEAVYTRAAVDSYLAAVTERRQELRAEIRAAEARAVRAELAAERISVLERSVGELVVGAVARNFDADGTDNDVVDIVD